MGCDNNATAPTDCFGIANGESSIDECGLCTGGTTNLEPNYLKDCVGICGGGAVEDCSGVCNGTTTLQECDVCEAIDGTFDCAGTCNGTVVEDCLGVCGGSAILSGCDNACNSTAVVDDCDVCNGGNANMDVCGTCFGGGESSCTALFGAWSWVGQVETGYHDEQFSYQYEYYPDANNSATATFNSNNTMTIATLTNGQQIFISGTFTTCSCDILILDFNGSWPDSIREIVISGNTLTTTETTDEGYGNEVITVVTFTKR